ncbi:MAG: trypsin-like serine protease [Pseudohongiellaceae bacterium]
MVSASSRLVAALMCTVLATVPASAIIIRHDTGYDEYFAREADFPAVFHLTDDNERPACIATLIDASWAITAAHCLRETPLQNHLDAGRPFSVEVAGQEVEIIDAVVHEHYAPDSMHGGSDVDLALLRLDRALGFPRPVPLYRQAKEQGRVMTFVGWGFHAVGSGGRFMNDERFRKARNTVTRAGDRLHFRFDDPVTPGSDALPLEGLPGTGDSGGPALLFHEERWHLAGVAVGELARQGEDGADLRQGLYGAVVLYERLSIHQQWIDAVTGVSAGR